MWPIRLTVPTTVLLGQATAETFGVVMRLQAARRSEAILAAVFEAEAFPEAIPLAVEGSTGAAVSGATVDSGFSRAFPNKN